MSPRCSDELEVTVVILLGANIYFIFVYGIKLVEIRYIKIYLSYLLIQSPQIIICTSNSLLVIPNRQYISVRIKIYLLYLMLTLLLYLVIMLIINLYIMKNALA